jgi:trigger factor
VTFPEEYHAENLKGKPATFKCTVTAIQEKDVPALDDEFAKDVSECETLEEYKAKTYDDLKKKADERDDVEFENAVIEAVVANAKIDIPAAMIEDRVDERLNEFTMNMRYQGLDMDTYYKITGQTEESIREQMKEMAENDVRTRLVLEAIQDAENVELSEDDIEAEIVKYVANNGGDLEKFRAQVMDNENMKNYFESMVKMQKTVKILKDAAVAPKAE